MMKYIVALLLMLLSPMALAVININKASVEELQLLKGIGVKKAADIVAYRKEKGAFKSVDELTKIKGIGVKTVDKLRNEIAVSDEVGRQRALQKAVPIYGK